MIGYSEVLQVIGAMIIFSLVLATSNRFMLNNDVVKASSEVEVRAVSIAQDLIEFSKTVPFDQATEGNIVPDDVPGDFVSNPIPMFTIDLGDIDIFFEKFNGYDDTFETDLGEFTISSVVEYMNVATDGTSSLAGSKTKYKRITVTVTNESMLNDVNLSYIRVYNNTN